MVKQQLAGRMESALLFCSRTLDVLKKIGLLYSATGSGHRILIGFHLDRFTQSWMYCWLLREFAAEDWIAPQRPRAASAHRAALSCSVFCCGRRRACSDILTLLIKKKIYLGSFYESDSIRQPGISTRPHRQQKCATFICVFSHCPYLLIDETLGTVSLSQMPSASSLSLISQANIVGFCLL